MGAREMRCEVHLAGRSTLASWLARRDARVGWLIAAMQGRQVICAWVLFFSLLLWDAATGNCQSYGQPIRMVTVEPAGCAQAQENSAIKGGLQEVVIKEIKTVSRLTTCHGYGNAE